MSDNYLRLLPTDHSFVPTPDKAERARRLASSLCPSADEVSATLPGKVLFFDCGANLESVSCPICQSDVTNWFFEEIDHKYNESGLLDLESQSPCCSVSLNLNDLEFDWPAGFASAAIEIRNPGRDWLTQGELEQLSATLGHEVRQILAHY
jgi:hypothetical protein